MFYNFYFSKCSKCIILLKNSLTEFNYKDEHSTCAFNHKDEHSTCGWVNVGYTPSLIGWLFPGLIQS